MSAPRRLLVRVVLACVLVAGPHGVWADPHRPGEPVSPTPLPPVTDWLWPDTSDFHDCDDNNCQNGGTCIYLDDDVDLSFCLCPSGFGGSNCEYSDHEFFECDGATTACLNGGTCISGSCLCPPEWEGFRCVLRSRDHVFFECDGATAACLNGGTCTSGFCLCPPEWEGFRCSERSVCHDYCQNRGVCLVGRDGSPRCLCPTNWSGRRCSHPNTESVCQGLCSNGGSCFVNENLETSCKCAGNWGGDNCTDYLDDSGSTGEHAYPVVLMFVGFPFVAMIASIFCGIACHVRKKKLRRQALQRPFRCAGAAVPALNPDPTVIYHPSVHNLGKSAAPAGTYPRASGSNGNSNGPQGYTNPMAGASGGGQRPTYDYAAGPWAGVAMPPVLEGVRPPMVGPRSELADRDPPAYDYAYAYAPEPPPYSALSGPATAPAAPSTAAAAPSTAGSRMTDHTYQSLSAYREPSVEPGKAASVYSVEK